MPEASASLFERAEDRADTVLWLRLDAKLTREEAWAMTDPEVRREARALDRRADRLEQARRAAR